MYAEFSSYPEQTLKNKTGFPHKTPMSGQVSKNREQAHNRKHVPQPSSFCSNQNEHGRAATNFMYFNNIQHNSSWDQTKETPRNAESKQPPRVMAFQLQPKPKALPAKHKASQVQTGTKKPDIDIEPGEQTLGIHQSKDPNWSILKKKQNHKKQQKQIKQQLASRVNSKATIATRQSLPESIGLLSQLPPVAKDLELLGVRKQFCRCHTSET